MRFLIDNALSPLLASLLSSAGHDAKHLRSFGKQDADDATVFALACDEDRILISADTDFGTLLATRQVLKPSVILFRHFDDKDPKAQARVLVDNVGQLDESLSLGALVVIESHRIRVRMLPL